MKNRSKSNFDNFLITRMNIKLPEFFLKVFLNLPKDVNDIEFLSHRFKIWESVSYPSVLSQTNKNFKWLILFDASLPSIFREKMETIKQVTNIIPVYITDAYYLLDEVKEIIKKESNH